MKNNSIDYEKEFSEEKFFSKLKKHAKKIGAKIVYYALILFYALQEPTVPFKAKAAIVSALGYFIVPFDLFPDIGPAGYTDDLGVLMGALTAVAMCITPMVKQKARQKMKDLFGDNIEEDIEQFENDLIEKYKKKTKNEDE